MARIVRGNKIKRRIYLNLNDVAKKKNIHRPASYNFRVHSAENGSETIEIAPDITVKISRTNRHRLFKYHNNNFKKIVNKAEKAIGNREDALGWLSAKQPALGNQVPYHLLSTKEGAQAVIDLLGRIKYGVYS